MGKLKTPLSWVASYIRDADGRRICDFGPSSFGFYEDSVHAREILDAVNGWNAPPHSPTVPASLLAAIEQVTKEWDRRKELFRNLGQDGWMGLAIGELKLAVEGLRTPADHPADASKMVPASLLAAWICRADSHGALVGTEVLEWAKANGGDSMHLNSDTLAAIAQGVAR